MKSLKFTFILCLAVVSLSCSKKDDTIAPASTSVMTAQVDGQAFTSEQATATYNKATKDLTLVGYNSVHMMGFTLVNFTGTSTITLVDISKTGSTGNYIDVKTNTTYANKEGRTGTVTVTKFDGSILEGNFSMKTYNSQQKREVVVTNGTFNVKVETI
ncbi:DUF6252 family protein [Spirosoma endbachense]|uniref:Lipocalin-like domain-containing protein n=1 Tax=Spirosoma endbachense TaxID=2666025 RepID=A0A6P1VLK2_9BACT|nr:DUF6252 family protein [Spirosoma endbachense]QHV94161.1 hypothetical protein GJR95_03560 [Spirosoma endbachense]